MRLHSMDQYSDEWFAIRRGRFTASVASKIITPKGSASVQYKKEIGRLIAEAMELQEADADIQTEWMARGSEMEEDARKWFMVDTGLTVHEVGFVTLGAYIGASPDALTDGGGKNPIPCEFKVVKPATHIQWMLAGGLPDDHKAQVHFQMVVCDAPHAWFMSYQPNLPPLIVKVERDGYTSALTTYLTEAEHELHLAFETIRGKQ